MLKRQPPRALGLGESPDFSRGEEVNEYDATQRRLKRALRAPAVDPCLVDEISEHGSTEVVSLLFAHPGCPEDVLRRSPVAAALNPNCPPDLLSRAVASGFGKYARAAARHPNCPLGALAVALDSDDTGLRRAAYANPGLPSSAFAHADHHHEQQGAAGNPSCPADVLARIVEHARHPAVLSAAAGNPAADAHTLRSVVRQAFRYPTQASARKAVHTVAARADCPPDLLERLSEHPDPSVRNVVASNAAAPDSVRAWTVLA